MNKLMLWTMSLAAFHGTALQAQDITGNWQGTVQPPGQQQQKIRVLFKIGQENDKLTATIYTVDRPSPPIATTISRDGLNVKITIPSINGKYDGKLSADGNSITGTLTQGAELPLTLVRATPETAWAIPEPPAPPKRMAPDANPAFEVATIRPSDPAHPEQIITLRGAEVITTNVTVHALINLAYWLHPKKLTGGPPWTETEKFDMAGKPDAPGQPNVDQMKLMIQKLLTDRFQLKFHFEKRELPVYAVRLAKTGAKILQSQDDPKGIPGWGFGRNASGMIMNFRNSPMSQFTAVLQNSTDRPVVDETGLAGRYDFTLRFTPDPTQLANFGQIAPANAADPDPPPDIFSAFEQQLGLKLQSTRTLIDVMVLEKIERPSPN